jgi:8-oxo-dGTP diphosphatase
MKFEFSAGGIVYKSQRPKTKDPKSGLYILLAKHSHHKGWVFPKGLIDREKKESKEQAAIREVKEETGAEGEIQKALEPSTFWYA